jgi:transcriptional regulator with XRE-family HTH domain
VKLDPRIKPYLKQVGRNIRAARGRAKLTQQDIEEKIGLEYKHYQRIEGGKINVTVGTIHRLAKLFKVREEELTKRD